jgi:zinc protease
MMSRVSALAMLVFLFPLGASAQPDRGAKPAPAPKAPAAPSAPAKTPASAPLPATVPWVAAATPATPKPTTKTIQLKLEVQREKLENGLRVVLAPDHTSPTIAVDVVYDVGGRNEERGHAGFAHLFEHMMFQGSANVPRGEHFKLVTSHGGTLNGTTNSDRTNYYELLPQSELALALWLEADRMKSLDISEKNFENQRAVVKEEYRMRVENAAYVPAEIRLQELVFQGYWPYEHSAIGSMRDLDAAKLEWVRAFHDSYYAPNNAIVSIAGDFDPAEAMAAVKRYFGNAKAVEVPKYEPGKMPEQTAPRDEIIEDPHAKLPAIFDGWSIPPDRDPEHYALVMASIVLTDGESSRLYRSLVREKSVAIEVDAGTNNHRGPDWFELTTKLAGGAKAADVAKLVDAEIARFSATGPTDAEVKKARARMEAHFVLGLQSNFARAQKLAEMELYAGDANLLNGELNRFLAVSGDDMRKAVAKYLTKARRTRVEVRPPVDAAAHPGDPKPKKEAPKAVTPPLPPPPVKK